jgi:hypothetical protein
MILNDLIADIQFIDFMIFRIKDSLSVNPKGEGINWCANFVQKKRVTSLTLVTL